MREPADQQPVFDLLICGDVVASDRILSDGYIAVHGEAIAAVGNGPLPPARSVERYDGALLFPGLVDAQVHAGSEEGLAGMEDATRAAAAGGVTVMVDMPFDHPAPVNSVERLEEKIQAVSKLASTDVALYATLSKDSSAARSIDGLARAGAAGIKLSTYEYHPVRFPRFSTGEMYDAFCAAAEVDLPVAFHNEDEELVKRFSHEYLSRDDYAPASHGGSRPPVAELVANAQILELASHTGVHCHIVHSSLAAGCEMAWRYRERGARVTVESCIHYLIFNEEDMLKQRALLKLNPPIRSEQEREALWGSLEQGLIDFISTDHVAWSLSRKSNSNMFKNAAGIPGLETLLPAFYTAASERGTVDPVLIARLAAESPARHFRLFPRKGQISPGADADIAVFRLQQRRFASQVMASKVKWTPYDGMLMSGFVAATYCRGRKIYDAGQVLVEPGFGRFISPQRAHLN
jgi:allantoinase